MTSKELKSLFDKHNDEYLKFDRVQHKKSRHPDLHAFLLLESRFPDNRSGGDMVTGAEHDEIYLFPKLTEEIPLTEGDVIELTRCGVRYDSNTDSFCMFV